MIKLDITPKTVFLAEATDSNNFTAGITPGFPNSNLWQTFTD
jgi:hypothetical protein